jgi:hypothetical protein
MDDTTVDAARAAGFEAAVTCEDAAVAPAADLLRLPRREVTRRREVRFDEWMSRVLTRGSV